MEIEFTGRHIEITSAVETMVRKELGKLERVLNSAPIRAHVIVSAEKHRKQTEIVVHWRDIVFTAVGENSDVTQSVTAAATKVQKQALKVKEKFHAKKRGRQPTSAIAPVPGGTIEAAPKTMVDLYGTANGFGWKLNDVIGAQVVSVPMSVPIRRANETFRTFMLSLAVVFVATFVLLNVMLHLMVIRRVTRLAAIADQVSLGNLDAGEFKSRSRDEIGVLTDALARMKISLVQAMKMLE